jgi:transcription initiation factor TFIIB
VCPACGLKSVESSFEYVDAVCTECGFVIHSDGSKETLRQLRESAARVEEAEKEQSWSDVVRVGNSTEQRVATALDCLESIGDQLELSKEVRLRAAELYVDVALKGLNDGRRTEDVVSAVVCLVTRQTGEPIPITRVATQTCRDSVGVGRVMKQIQRELKIECTDCLPESYVGPLCTPLGCDNETVERACELVQSARAMGLVDGRNPVGVAAAAIYLIERGERTQREVAEVGGISRETIRVRLQEFRQGGVIDA